MYGNLSHIGHENKSIHVMKGFETKIMRDKNSRTK